jgi:hypothetical protein
MRALRPEFLPGFAEVFRGALNKSFHSLCFFLRRGGATFWFSKHGSLDRLLIHGRWQTPKTARIYINNGLATLAEMKIPMSKLRGFVNIYKHSLAQPVPNLEHAHKSSSEGRGKRRKNVAFC